MTSDKKDIKHDYERICMQLYSPLTKKCNNQDNYAICLIKNNIEIGTGNTVQFQLYFYILKYIIVNLKELIFLYKQKDFLQN